MNEIPIVSEGKLPFIGHGTKYSRDPLSFYIRSTKQYGDFWKLKLGQREVLFVNDPMAIRHILQENHSNYKKNLAYQKLAALMGEGLFTAEGQKWLVKRRMAQPHFSKKHLASYKVIMQEEAAKVMGQWGNADRLDSETIRTSMVSYALEVVTRTLLGNTAADRLAVIERCMPFVLEFVIGRITTFPNMPLGVPTSRNQRFHQYRNELDQLIFQLINDKKKNPGEDLLSVLLQGAEEARITDQDLRDEVITYFLAGHETSATGLYWTLFCLGQNPGIQDRFLALEKEQQDVYLDKIIVESLRLYPPVWVIGREALATDVLGNYQIEKGQSVIFSPFLMHRDERYWDRALDFDPDRFDGVPDRNHWIPFGNGPRLCIGQHFAMMEMKVMLYELLNGFRFETKSKTAAFDYSLTLRPSSDNEVTAIKR